VSKGRNKRQPTRRPVPPAVPAGDRPLPGDELLQVRDRGAVRAYVRDAVDARRTLRPLALFVPAFGLAMITAVGPSSELGTTLLIGSLVVLAVVALDAYLLGSAIVRMARAEFPKAQINGRATGWYVFMRAHRPRSMRLPRTRVSPG
jgi:hypothetical protein